MGTVSGPFTKEFRSSDQRAWWRRTWYRQTHPRTRRLAYAFDVQDVTPNANGGPPAGSVPFTSISARDRAYQAAYTQFEKHLGESASLAVSLAERRQAVDMIVKRSLQILDFARAIRKGRFGEAASILGVAMTPGVTEAKRNLERRNRMKRKFKWGDLPSPKRPPKGKRPNPSKAKSFADNYLEFHFGWSPLVADIYAAAQVLTDGIPPPTVKGRGTRDETVRKNGTYGFDEWTVTVKCQLIADVKISDENLNLLDRLGLVNPATVLWDLVPFSFVVDWFANLGQCLTSWLPPTGVVLDNGAVTYCETWTYRQDIPSFGLFSKARMFIMRRDALVGAWFATPKLVLLPFKGFSPRRGAAAISLLIQQLTNPGRRGPKPRLF